MIIERNPQASVSDDTIYNTKEAVVSMEWPITTEK